MDAAATVAQELETTTPRSPSPSRHELAERFPLLSKTWSKPDWKALTAGLLINFDSLGVAEHELAAYEQEPCSVLSWRPCRCDVPYPTLNSAEAVAVARSLPDLPFVVRATSAFGDCVTAALAKRGVPIRALTARFDADNDERETARSAIQALVAGDVPGLFLAGPVGVGKTLLAVEALRSVAERWPHGGMKLSLSSSSAEDLYGLQSLGQARRVTLAPPVLFVNVSAALEARRRAIDVDDGGKSARRWDMACQERFVVLDDLGAERPTDWAIEQTFVLVNSRYEAMRPTVITSNLSLEDLAETLGPRVVDRLTDMVRVVPLNGKSRRGQLA